jgi:glucan phosphoethanolaminetransferase (alkaline phosphatase superfamily)
MIACRYHRRRVRRLVALVALAGIAACGPGETARPSVVLVVIDALRRDHLSLYGYAKDTSPGLARLAQLEDDVARRLNALGYVR